MKLYIYSVTTTLAPLKIGNRKVVSSHTYFGCDYLFMLGLKLKHVIKMGLWCLCRSHVRFSQHSVVMSLYNMYQTSWAFLRIHYSQYSHINTRTCLILLVFLYKILSMNAYDAFNQVIRIAVLALERFYHRRLSSKWGYTKYIHTPNHNKAHQASRVWGVLCYLYYSFEDHWLKLMFKSTWS